MKYIFKLIILPLLLLSTLMAEPNNTKIFTITNTNLLHWHHLRADAGTDQETNVGQSIHIIGNVHGVHPLHQHYVHYKWTLNNIVIARTAEFDYTPSTTGIDTLKLKVYYFCYSASDTMQVTVRTPIQPLQVDAGPSINTPVGRPINIHGTASEGTPPYTYKWTSNGQVLANTQDFEYPAIQQGNYPLRLTVTDYAGVIASDNTSIHVTGSTLTVNAGEDKTILEGSKTTITGIASGGSEPYRYKWKYQGVILANTPSFEYNASHITGDYTLTLEVTDNTGTIKEDSMIVHIHQSTLTVDAGENKTMIEDTDENITGTVTGGTAPYVYEWSVDGNIIYNTLSFPYHATERGTHTFTFKVTDSVGTIKTDTLTITVKPAPITLQANAGEDNTTTVGHSIILYGQATGGASPYHYEWTLNDVQVSDSPIYRFIPEQAGEQIFTLTVTDNKNQESTDTVIINVNEVLTVDAGQDQYVTIGTPVTLHATVTGGIQPYKTYRWALNGSIVGTEESYTYIPDTVNIQHFNVQVTDATNTRDTDSVTVTVTADTLPLAVEANASKQTIEVDQTTTLTANVEGGTAPYTYAWTLDGDPQGTGRTLDYTGTTVGTKTFTLTVTDANQNTKSTTVTVTVTSGP